MSEKGQSLKEMPEALKEEQICSIPVKCIGLGDMVLEHGAPGQQRKDLKLDPEGIFDTIMTFYGSVAEMAAVGNGKKLIPNNGKKGMIGNGNNCNGKNSDHTVKQALNG